MSLWKIGIVGGGPGGLMTAYSLQSLANSAFDVTLFEASSRLGGKILTPRFAARPVRYEAGAAEFYDYSLLGEDPLRELVEELGLPVRSMGGPAVVMDGQVLSNLDDIRDQLGPAARQALVAFDRRAKDRMSPGEFYHSADSPTCHDQAPALRFDTLLDEIPDRPARRYVENLIHSDLAAEPDQTLCGYGLQNYLMNDPAYMRLYGIEGGNERLVAELARRIAARILLDRPVDGIRRTADSRLVVRSTAHGQICEDTFDFVVVALPHNQLASVTFSGERLDRAMRAHRARYNHPAHYLRITVLFDRPFWRDALPDTDSYWMLDQFGGCCLYDESSRDPGVSAGVLGWLLAGQAARQMSDWDDTRLIQHALRSLPAFLGAANYQVLEGRVHRWVAAVSALPGGAVPTSLDRRHQPEPIEHSHLFVVGDYLYDATLNGVLDAAQYVAGWLAARMSESSRSNA